MREPNDWRLTSHLDYLKGAVVHHRAYVPKAGDDHDHCVFCWAKFWLDGPTALKQGYHAMADEQWICEECFADFKDLFEWKAKG